MSAPSTPSPGASPKAAQNYADALERICALHDPSTIAAVIVEPMAGSGGVYAGAEGLPQAPARHLRQARDLADPRRGHHGFGRLGHAFAAERYGIVPDMITFAKGITNARGADGRRAREERNLRRLPEEKDWAIELFHGYTYSGHPLAAAAGLATLDLYRDEDLFARAKTLEPHSARWCIR